MATRVYDYRFDQFQNVPEPVQITDEEHTIPANSPYTIRLNEVPQKNTPSNLIITFEDGTALAEVSAMPTEGQYYPDYYTKADGDDNWNTGTIMFNSADKGKKIKVSYLGMGTLVDSRNSGVNRQTFTTACTHSFTVPAFVRELKVTCIGGAGGGGGGNQGAGGGTGATGYVNQKIVSVIPSSIHTVTIGAGGAGGVCCLGVFIFSIRNSRRHRGHK